MIVLRNARIVSELTPEWEGEYADVMLNEDRIVDIVTAGTAKGDEVIELDGKTILPGFIDAHVHLDLLGENICEENTKSDAMRVMLCFARATASLKSGFTTLRDMGDRNNIVIDLATSIKEGVVNGPEIIPSGMIITPTEIGNQYINGLYVEADGYQDVIKATRRQIQSGAEWIKYMGTGAMMNPGGVPGAPIYTQQEVDAIVDTAKMHHIQVAGHNHGVEGIKSAIKAGVRTIEHATCVNEEIIEMVKNSTESFLIFTLAPYEGWDDPETPAHYKENDLLDGAFERFYKAYQSGIKIGFGTDAGAFRNSHGNNLIEFKIRCLEVGMKPIDVLLQATKHNSEILQIDSEVGTIEAGKKADIVIIDGKPDQRIMDVNQIHLVIKSGRIIR